MMHDLPTIEGESVEIQSNKERDMVTFMIFQKGVVELPMLASRTGPVESPVKRMVLPLLSVKSNMMLALFFADASLDFFLPWNKN
jgi:hypothetical protein